MPAARGHFGRIGAQTFGVQPFNGPLTLRVAGQSHSVGLELAGHVFVEPHCEETV